MLLYHADGLETVDRAGKFHIDAEVHDVGFPEIVREVNEEVESDSESIRRGLRSSSKHDLHEGEDRFVDERPRVSADPDETGRDPGRVGTTGGSGPVSVSVRAAAL